MLLVISSHAATSITAALRSASGSRLQSEDDDIHRRWTALGENWWQPFADGFQHGANALGETPFGYPEPQVTWSSAGHSTAGGDLIFIHEAYAGFLGNSSALSQAWDACRMHALNTVAFGTWQNLTCHFPRIDENSDGFITAIAKGAVADHPLFVGMDKWQLWAEAATHRPPRRCDKGNCTGEKEFTESDYHCEIEKNHFVDAAFDEYYAAVGHLPQGIDLAAASTPREALGATLRPLATLFALLAEFHPFNDGNSRTRGLVLQAELTRLGGHPVLLPEFWRSVYDQDGIEDLERTLLQGWCAYEHSLHNDGQSPFAAPMQEWDRTHGPDRGSLADNEEPTGMVALRSLDPREPIVVYVRSLAASMYDAENDACLV